MIGETVSHYEIVEHLGGGGMGIVYRARDLKLDRPVALKFLPPELTRDPDARQRFIHEAKAASALQHTNICVVHDIDEAAHGQMFIVMEFYEGETLKKKIERGPLSVTEAVQTAIQVGSGLAKAHENGIIHRDIKPANIILTNDGVAKIVDFGLAKLSRLTMVTRTGTTLGTVAYMSPEQARGEAIDQRSDIWSLGVVLYEMITGRLPFEGQFEAGILYSILNTEPVDLSARTPDVPPQLERIVNKALAKQQESRYQQCQEMVADLRNAFPGSASTTAAGAPPVPRRLRRVAKWAIPLIVATAVGTGYLVLKGTKAPQTPSDGTSLPAQGRSSIAVLPFDDLSPAKDQEYFCSGMAEEIRASLSRIPDLKVVGGTSAAALKRRQMGVREIGKELGVATVLEGSVRKDAGRIRITLQLSDAADGFARWSETYDRELKDVFSVQEDISRSVAANLKIALAPEVAGFMYPRRTESVEAYEHVLKGNHYVKLYLISYQERDFQSALNMYEKAIAKDTGYAMAYAGMAWAYEHHYVYGRHSAAREYATDREQAFRNIEHAYRLDPNSGPVNAGMAYIAVAKGALDQAYEYCRKALALEPRSLYVNHLVGEFAATLGLYPLAIKFFSRAIELDPLYLLSLGETAACLEWMGQFDQATDFYRRTLELSPDDRIYKADYIRLLTKTGRYSEADKVLESALRNKPNLKDYSSSRAILLALQGAREEALKSGPNASVYAVLGANEKALALLEASSTSGIRCSYFDLLHNPFYEKIRTDPRFRALLARQKQLYEDRLAKYGGL